MDICCGSTSRQRKPKARNLVFGWDSTLTKGHSPACKSAIAICSATAVRSPQQLRSRNAAIEAKFYIRTHSSSIQILYSLRDCLLSPLITMGTQNLKWVDDSSSVAKLLNTTRRR